MARGLSKLRYLGTARIRQAEHARDLVERFADRIVLCAEGGVLADGPPAEVLRSAAAARAFGVELHVGALPDGTPFVAAVRELPA